MWQGEPAYVKTASALHLRPHTAAFSFHRKRSPSLPEGGRQSRSPCYSWWQRGKLCKDRAEEVTARKPSPAGEGGPLAVDEASRKGIRRGRKEPFSFRSLVSTSSTALQHASSVTLRATPSPAGEGFLAMTSSTLSLQSFPLCHRE